MLIGEDYNKIELELFGLDLVEPNAFIGDLLLFLLALYFSRKCFLFDDKSAFFRNWGLFFLIFGTGFLLGGFGHLLFNYFGVSGRSLSWVSGIVASLFVERAMISIHPSKNTVLLVKKLINIKFALAIIAELAVLYFIDMSNDITLGLKVPILNTTIGSVYIFGVLGYFYAAKFTKSFNYLLLSIVLVFPTILLQTFKINFHQWFDRNDASHVFLALGLLCYYYCVKGYNEHLKKLSFSEQS